MVFSSLVFLFLFLPLVIISYFLIKKEFRNGLLLIASLVFYFWGEQWLVIMLMISILVNYTLALLIARRRKDPPTGIDRKETYQKLVLIVAVAFNLTLLGYYKYANFFITEILLGIFNVRLQHWETIALPIGISFYTFQALSYVIDVYRDEVPATRNIIHFGCYVTSFPQLIAGPIVRYIDIYKQLINRVITYDMFSTGIKRFVIGLAKKVLIANTVGKGADLIFGSLSENLNPALYWMGALCYAIQIYFDFSGYSDMAIGLGRIFGFKFLENFTYPYIAKSIQEFWKRWHISLSTWFRDYLYIPLGGSRVRPSRLYCNLFIVFILCGFWHGASWNFVVWGLYHGFFLVLERLCLNKILKVLPSFIRHVYTLTVVTVGWVLFRSDNLHDAVDYIGRMFGLGINTTVAFRTYVDIDIIYAFFIGAICSLPYNSVWKRIISRNNNLFYVADTFQAVILVVLFSVSIFKIASGTFNPFLYFRF